MRERNETGITLVSLLITVIILMLLAGVVIAGIIGNDGILKVSTSIKGEYILAQYQEQILNIVERVILKNQILGKETTLEDIAEELEKEEWIESAKVDEDLQSVFVQTTDGYIFQVYYNEEQGQMKVEYVGNGENIENVLENLPKMKVTYDKEKAQIQVEATSKKRNRKDRINV